MTMKEQIRERWGRHLPGRVRQALINSDYATLEEAEEAFRTNYTATVDYWLRRPGCGRETVNQLMSALAVQPPKPTVTVPDLSQRYLTVVPKANDLTTREIALIRKLMSSYIAIDPDAPVCAELRAIRDKL